MNRLNTAVTAAVFTAAASFLFGQTAQDTLPERPRLMMRHADHFEMTGEGRNEIYRARGNVEFVQGKAHFRCSSVEYGRLTEFAVFQGPVEIYDGTRTLNADRVHYSGVTRIEEAFGNVTLRSGNNVLNAEYVRYSQPQRTAVAETDVVIKDLVEHVTLSGGEAFYDIDAQYGSVANNPRMVRTDSLGSDSIVVTGRFMEAWQDSGLVSVCDSVEARTDDLRAACSQLRFLSDQDSIFLQGEPVVWQEDQRMDGDTITILLDEMTVKKGWIIGRARIVSTDTARADMMSGRAIIFTAETDSLKKVLVSGQATSVYYVDEDEKGINTFSGDSISLTFHGKKLQRLIVESSPGKSSGRFIPRETETALPDSSGKTGAQENRDD